MVSTEPVHAEPLAAPETVSAAVRATYAAFIGSGFAFASWASRIPQVRDGLHLDPSELGLVLFAIAVGSIISLPLSGRVVTRLGTRRTVAGMALLLGVGLGIAAVGYLIGVAPVVVGLFLLGFANGAWDVAMNVQGAFVERQLGRSILPRFHAGYSFGTVAGALAGTVIVAAHVPVTVHLAATAVLIAIVVPLAVRGFLPDAAERPDPDAAPPSAGEAPAPGADVRSKTAWREPRTILIGVFVLAFAFAEGTGNDWINVALIDGYHQSAAIATFGFAVFLAAMTTGRWFGPAMLDRFGRVPVVRTLTAVAVLGLLLFVFGPHPVVAFVGAVLWGLGISLGFPLGMSAGADDPARAAVRVSVIASIGYCAFLGGPPLIGFLGQHFTVLRALTAVGVLLVVAEAVAGNVRPPRAAVLH